MNVAARSPCTPGANRMPTRQCAPRASLAPPIQVVLAESMMKLLPTMLALPITRADLLVDGFPIETIRTVVTVPTLCAPNSMVRGVNVAGPDVGVGEGVGVGVGEGVGVAVGVGVGEGVGVGVGVGVAVGAGVGANVTVKELLVPVCVLSVALMVTPEPAAVNITDVDPKPATKAGIVVGLIDPAEYTKVGVPV